MAICQAVLKDESFIDFDTNNPYEFSEEDYDYMDLSNYYDKEYPISIEKTSTVLNNREEIQYFLSMTESKTGAEYASHEYTFYKTDAKNNYNLEFDTVKNVNRPLIIDGMIAIMPDGSEVEDIYLDSWYSYTENYSSFAHAEFDGDTYVWIPRYAYKIQDFYNRQKYTDVPSTAISTVFLRSNTDYMFNNEILPDGYLVHPAFSSNGNEYPGIWVQKNLEGTYTSLSSPLYVENEAYNLHMMTNTEFGASAYLMWSLDNSNDISFNQDEYVAASVDTSGVFNDKYVTIYDSSNIEYSVIGDAMGETPWGTTYSDFPDATNKYIIRKFSTGNLFDFTNSTGNNTASYRGVIVVPGDRYVSESGTYVVSFDANGGAEVTNKITVSYGSKYGALPTPAERSGFIFDGWYTGVTGGSKVTTGTTVQLEKNHTLYARWTPIVGVYVVSTDSNKLIFTSERRYTSGAPAKSFGTVVNDYGDIYSSTFEDETDVPWSSIKQNITQVVFEDEIKPRDLAYWFNDFTSLTSFINLYRLNTKDATNMKYMFANCSSLETLDLSNFNTSNVTSMQAMFLGCTKLIDINMDNFNTKNVESMESMFNKCSSLVELDVSDFNTENVKSMHSMFYECALIRNLNVENFNTINVETMNGMFYGCSAVKSLDLSKFDTRNVTDMSKLFYGCKALESINLDDLNTTGVRTMDSMFYQCKKLQELDIKFLQTSNVTNMYRMFYECENLKTIYACDLWKTTAVTNGAEMFLGSTKLVGGWGTTYDENHVNLDYARLDDGPDSLNPGYFTFRSAFPM